jgi:Ca-activated chloride channel family protein
MGEFFTKFMVNPGYVVLFLALLPVAVLVVVAYQRNNRAVRLWFSPHEYRFFLPEVKMILRLVALILILFGLMGPFWGPTEQQIAKLGREVYILIDVSASMNTEDIKPSRLEKVKLEVKKMLGGMTGDKVGLIVFTSDAYVQCPLTSDHAALMLYLDMIGSYQFASTGTSFREALLVALDRFTNKEKNARKTTRAAILISDGEDFGEEYESVVARMQNNGITVFPVGVGTDVGGPVPNIVKGEKRGFKQNKEGGQAISVLKPTTLENIADQFGVEYHAIKDQIDNLDPVTEQIQMLSASVMDRETRKVSINRYQWFLGLGLLCFVVTLFWMPVRPSRAAQREF